MTLSSEVQNPHRQIARTTKFRTAVHSTYLWLLSMERAACRPSDAYIFEMAPRFLEKFCAPGLGGRKNLRILYPVRISPRTSTILRSLVIFLSHPWHMQQATTASSQFDFQFIVC